MLSVIPHDILGFDIAMDHMRLPKRLQPLQRGLDHYLGGERGKCIYYDPRRKNVLLLVLIILWGENRL
jgi:hypothetical protein